MCVIIHRQAGVEIPYEKLKNAVSRNRDGFGLITHLGSGELDVRHEFDPKGNDPEFIQSLLLDAKDHPVSLHLRYSTAGELSKLNCHPFKVGSKEDIGRDVYFFHNGTISQFSTGKKGPSDSNLFSKAIVQHAVKMAVDAYGEDWHKSPALSSILEYYAGTYSVFTLVDNYTGNLIINRDLGKEFDGWWASNNSYFHSPASTTYYSYGGSSKSTANPPGQSRAPLGSTAADSKTSCGMKTGTTSQTSSTTTTPSNEPANRSSASQTNGVGGSNVTALLPWDKRGKETENMEYVTEAELLNREAKKLKSFLDIYTSKEDGPTNGFIMFKSIGSEKFRDLAGVYSLRDLVSLDPDDIDDIVDQFPRMASMLICDLLAELYIQEGTATVEKKSHVG